MSLSAKAPQTLGRARLARHPRFGFSGFFTASLVWWELAAPRLSGSGFDCSLLEAQGPLDRGLFGNVGCLGHLLVYNIKSGVLQPQSVIAERSIP